MVHSPKAELREAAYRSLLEKQKDNLDKFFAIYQAIVKDWDYEAKLRGYETPIQVRNFANQISDKAIENLLSVCQKNRTIFQDFFKYKAKILGQNKLKRFDIYAPIESKEKQIRFDEAVAIVKDVFNEFSPQFGNLANKVIDQKHIDSHPQPNKRSGAFCATVNPKITPYVMLNFTGRIRDVSTLAHELGHAVHSLLASQHLPSVQHANLPLAETASTLAEMILFENLYQKETDPKIRKSMLMEKLADSYASILRQNYFVIFEIRAHELISKGCTAKQLSELWLETLKEQFGDSVEIDQIFKYEWSYIPHIVNTPFYCYAYNFGELLSYALFARYKNERQEFVSNIETILMAGGSQNPTKILKEVGIDINSKQIWNDSFFIIKEWQLRLEQL
ncbi:MAG: M3 family oligoendopeptidase [Candidatus Shapirobacteria bacterium]|nr:M3 family oligoendopeptidase [Candidatus Shapirobacteria bacterium]